MAVATNDVRRIRTLDRDHVEPTETERRIARLRETFPRRALDVALQAGASSSAAIAQIASWGRAIGGGGGFPDMTTETTGKCGGIVVIAGAPGCGKTVAAAWLALQQTNGTAPAFLRATEFATLSRYDAQARARWQSPRWLVLDDLGAEYVDTKGSFRTDLDELVDVFYADERTLVITTNCTADEFRARYGVRVVDRLRECGAWLAVAGGSMRGGSDGSRR